MANADAVLLAQQSNYGIVASCAFLVYDVILILPDEIAHIWSAKWSFPKIVYLSIRYYGAVYLVATTIISLRVHNSYQICGLFNVLSLYGGINLFAALANIINALRLHALYNGNRTVLITFLLLTAGQFAAGLYASVGASIATRSATAFSPDIIFSGCPLSYNPQVMWAAWTFNLFNTSASFILTIWDFTQSVRRISRLTSFSGKNTLGVEGVGPLLLLFVQDGSIHYISVLAALLVFLVFAILVPNPLGHASCSWLVAMYAFSATRLILNLRIYAARQQGGSTWQQTLSIRIQNPMQERVSEGDAEDAVELNSCGSRA